MAAPCDPAIFQANAKITPTSTGPMVEASPARPRAPRSLRGLDPRCTASPLGTETQRTSAPRRRGPRHQKVITQRTMDPRQDTWPLSTSTASAPWAEGRTWPGRQVPPRIHPHLRPYEEQMKKYSTANFGLTNGIFVLTCVLMTLRSFRSDMLCFQLCEAGKEAFILK